jgi:hypothetical protein
MLASQQLSPLRAASALIQTVNVVKLPKAHGLKKGKQKLKQAWKCLACFPWLSPHLESLFKAVRLHLSVILQRTDDRSCALHLLSGKLTPPSCLAYWLGGHSSSDLLHDIPKNKEGSRGRSTQLWERSKKRGVERTQPTPQITKPTHSTGRTRKRGGWLVRDMWSRVYISLLQSKSMLNSRSVNPLTLWLRPSWRAELDVLAN